ncbi:nucleotidyltransferase domain-containing protein [Desertivirga brevis]|uniref:nucleotidyltransferase domain-containing protein n=1 Tax=Desertivirga brevis TaxID=2810310 RepID=UPI001A970497|nr:nucleotidyltransferase domain-containing protein [Pedobacter sp. SYSU D00873]
MIQQQFIEKAKAIFEKDNSVTGMAVGGSWLTKEIDEFSDVDLVLFTEQKVSGDRELMLQYARSIGDFLSGFTGEHVGEPRVLICLYDNPLLHVDIKFLTIDEFSDRVETPVILIDKTGMLAAQIAQSQAKFPYPDYQWIEDRFWTWVHYALLKIGRGEYMEAFDFFGFLRMVVFGPLLHIKNNNLPRGVRKVEMSLNTDDFINLQKTIPQYSRQSLLESLHNSVVLYKELRAELFVNNVQLQKNAEVKVLEYFEEIKKRK